MLSIIGLMAWQASMMASNGMTFEKKGISINLFAREPTTVMVAPPAAIDSAAPF